MRARHRHPVLGLKLLVPCSFIHVHTLCDEVLHFGFEAAGYVMQLIDARVAQLL
jgi:hypothetical protein